MCPSQTRAPSMFGVSCVGAMWGHLDLETDCEVHSNHQTQNERCLPGTKANTGSQGIFVSFAALPVSVVQVSILKNWKQVKLMIHEIIMNHH